MAQSTSPSSSAAGGRKRLGRGLSSLLNTAVKVALPEEASHADADQVGSAAAPPPGASQGEGATSGFRMIETAAIEPNQFQPRRNFDEASLEQLAASIREAGLMQPVVVRPGQSEGVYELIAGERRWRAARMLGLEQIPAVLRDVDGQTAAQWALIENLQREDLNTIERAEAFRRLADEFALTHQDIAERVGLDRTSVTNHLRLLELDAEILQLIGAGQLSMGHGRALLAITNTNRRRLFAIRSVKDGWSVRELERRAKASDSNASQRGGMDTQPALPVHLQDIQRRLGEHLGAKVQIQLGKKKGSGKLIVEFYGFDDFEGILDRFGFDACV